MEIKTAMAGTLESGDIFIQIAPNDNAGLHIDLDSTVAYQFGDQIKKVITETEPLTAPSAPALRQLPFAPPARTCGPTN